jgi:hypothetical protein
MRKRTKQRTAVLTISLCLATVAAGSTAYAADTTPSTDLLPTLSDSALVNELTAFAQRCAGGADPTCANAASLARSVVATLGGCAVGALQGAGTGDVVADSPLVGPDSLGCSGVVAQAREAGLALLVFVDRCLDGSHPTCATVTNTVDAAAAAVRGCAAAAVEGVADEVSVPAPPDELQCGATVTLVRDELMYVVTLVAGLGNACVTRTAPLCATAFDAVELVQDSAQGCLAGALAAAGSDLALPVTGTDPACGGAVNTLAALAAALVALADDCLSGSSTIGAACSDANTLVTGVGSAVVGCATLAAGSPCRTALDAATDAVVMAQATAAACLGGEQAQCAAAAALVDDVAHCSEITQAAGLCVGYYTTDDEQDPVLAAIAGALATGGVPGAYLFAQGSRQSLDAAQTALVDAAFDAEAAEAGTGAALIYDSVGLGVPDVALPDTGQAAKYTPKEAKHGHCCATRPQAWKWKGTEVQWGYCETNDWGYTYCTSLGHFWSDVSSDIDSFPHVYWFHEFLHKDGYRADFENLSVRMKQDIANKADPTKAKYSCGSGKAPLSCWENRDSPNVTGNHYYDELNADVSCDCGKPRVHMQVQTRRWYVWSGGHPFYPAYDNGG